MDALKTETQGEHHVEMEAEARGMQLQARNTKACQQPPEARKSKEGLPQSLRERDRERHREREREIRALPTPRF